MLIGAVVGNLIGSMDAFALGLSGTIAMTLLMLIKRSVKG